MYLPPDLTDALQPIDAGYGRSLRCAIGGGLLDNWWLMADANMEAWEGAMKPAERHVLMSKLVADATEETVKCDDLRIGSFGSFIRTGQLITKDESDDNHIRPQGLSKPIVISREQLGDDESEFATLEHAVSPEEQERGLTTEDMAIVGGVDESEIGADDIVADDSDDSDNDAEDDEPIRQMVARVQSKSN